MKNKSQQRCVQFFPFLVFHPSTCLSFPQDHITCPYYMCMLFVPCPIELKVAKPWQFEGRQRSICCMSWLLLFLCLLIMLIQILWSLSSLTSLKRFWPCGCLSNFHQLINLNNFQTLLLVLWSPKLHNLKSFSTLPHFWLSLWRWWKLSL